MVKIFFKVPEYWGTHTSAHQRVERLTDVLVLRKLQPHVSVRGDVNVRYYREWAHDWIRLQNIKRERRSLQ